LVHGDYEVGARLADFVNPFLRVEFTFEAGDGVNGGSVETGRSRGHYE
jgi:hypothetical protein